MPSLSESFPRATSGICVDITYALVSFPFFDQDVQSRVDRLTQSVHVSVLGYLRYAYQLHLPRTKVLEFFARLNLQFTCCVNAKAMRNLGYIVFTESN